MPKEKEIREGTKIFTTFIIIVKVYVISSLLGREP